MSQLALESRLDRELSHFNQHYAQEAAQGIEPLSDFDKVRYSCPPANTIFPREYYYHLLGHLAGKKVLEIACGNGIDACICAHNGAQVHAYDLSSSSVELVRRRAEANGLSNQIHLQVTGDFDQAFAGQTFDAIIGYAALHHVPMQGLAERIYDRLNPGGVAVFAEPVINSRALHRLRRCVPYSFWENTDDEVPLNDQAITEFAKPFDHLVRREFQFVSRLWPMFPHCFTLAKCLHQIDQVLLKTPMLRRFATVVVFAVYRRR